LVSELERRKTGATDRPRFPVAADRGTRHIPAAVKRAVWQRDAGRCAFVGALGRCTETGLLEYHHILPFAEGGETSTGNVSLRCRAHNTHEAQEYLKEID
jgi:5-methylcytosine-specific restriction endonuclease McrA